MTNSDRSLQWFRFALGALTTLGLVSLVSCGGGGGGTSPPPTPRSIVSLAKVPSGGAQTVSLSNNRLYFANYNRGETLSVSVDGGEIVTHYMSTGSPGSVVHRTPQISILNTETSGSLQALPETAEGIATLSVNQTISSSPQDIVADGTYVYWSEFDNGIAWSSRILRIPLVPTASSPIDISTGASTDRLLPFDLQGIAKIARDGNQLFASEGVTGNIYKIDLSSGSNTTLASGLSTGTLNRIPLAVAGNYLYAVIDSNGNAFGQNGTSILQIDKISGNVTTVATGIIVDGKIKADGGAIYWWDQRGANVVLRRLASQTGQITDLATIATATIYDFIVDGTNVWWFIDASIGNVSIQSVPVTGGIPATLATFDATLGTSYGMAPRAIAADSTSFYWLGQINAIMSLPKTGGIPAVLTREVNSAMTALTLTSTHLVWGENYGGRYGGIRKMPKTGQTTPVSPWSAIFPSMSKHMTVDASTLFWITENFNPTSTGVFSTPVAGGPVQNIGTLDGNGTRVFPYIDALFVAKNTSGGYVISVMPKTGGVDTNVVISNVEIVDLYVVDDVLYFIASDGSSGSVYSYNLNTGQSIQLVQNRPSAKRLYVDTSHVYWSEANVASGGVYRVSRSGGSPETIYTGRSSFDIVGDISRIYWAAGWEVLRTNK